MSVSFDNIQLHSDYTRPQLAVLWGFKSYEAIARGIVTPAGTQYIIFFITKEKQSFLTQYNDVLEDENLQIEGETNHAADQRIVQSDQSGDEIHLFYREKHHRPFTYKGKLYLIDHMLLTDKPSRFHFALNPATAAIEWAIRTERETHGIIDDGFISDDEGRKRLSQHISYERSRKNRLQAIKIHGTSCLACGFSFNKTYGASFAKNFIEVHHVKSIVAQKGTPVNPENDLIPLCSNCHSMAHRERGRILSLTELQIILKKSV